MLFNLSKCVPIDGFENTISNNWKTQKTLKNIIKHKNDKKTRYIYIYITDEKHNNQKITKNVLKEKKRKKYITQNKQ